MTTAVQAGQHGRPGLRYDSTTNHANEGQDTTDTCSREPRRDGDTRCRGDLAQRVSRSGLTTSVICAGHRDELEGELDRVARRYGSRTAPSWFDPSYAGESWDGE